VPPPRGVAVGMRDIFISNEILVQDSMYSYILVDILLG
jgi:hypothetical protein